MNTFYKLLLTAISVFTANSLYAQTSSKPNISGVILDENKKPADYVTVVLFKATDSSVVKTAFTDQAGNFNFLVSAKGDYFYKASMMGYKTLRSKTFKLENADQKIDFGSAQLSSASQNLKEVTVAFTKPLIERKSDKLVMNVENSSIATGSTALELLQKAPGVSVDQNDNISMQGKQGVLIMLDGKQTYMSSADVANLLRNMQSSQIESIELITNPSSKYDAAGNSGIINIKTKKSKSAGTNGSLNLGAGQGKNFRGNAGIDLNHRDKKFNLYGNYNYFYNKNSRNIYIDRISNGVNGNPDTYFSQGGGNIRHNNSNGYKVGLDIFLNKNNTLGFLVNGYSNTSNQDENNKTLIGPSFSKLDSFTISNSFTKNSYKNIAYNINYKSVLDTAGQEITFDGDYSSYKGNSNIDYINDYFFANGTPIRPTVLTRNATPTNIKIKAFKIDYTLPISKTVKFETGIKSSWVTTDNNFAAEQFVNNIWQNDVHKSNQFIYDENVNAAYANLNKQFKSTSIQLGLRAEQTNSKGNSITENKIVKRDYLDFFPSVFINQALSKNNDLGISYSRRIDRPSYDDLNPFIYFLDQYTYQKGNPFLNPQYTHNFELNYTFMKKYIAALSYSRTSDLISQVLLPDGKALFQTNENLAKQEVWGLNINAPVKIFKWWETNNNLNIFNLKYDSPNLAGRALSTNKTSFQFKTQHTFTIAKGFTGELSGNYESPIDGGTIAIKERYGVDMGLSKSFMEKKMNLKFSLSDVFKTQKMRANSTLTGLEYTIRQDYDSRVARISFTYRFGQNEIKPARRRSTGLESEQGRIKN
ncbi:TonB-dependent receptor domain-containing protein [Pedobacter punctiformis]|uniref:TonB-dependent receptor n=1 Tax=Pedobacter punctiformis TaxID=3004097 RepID=A0ABT4L654_9SPHI|nr:TonB-dependent receptor [Pedobacter sp. HCMS5-2]MCZ4243406.1 TonB-dependent receptor [Pedobacter sp. HCMS5-2]